MTPQFYRENSLTILAKNGLSIPSHLPLLDEPHPRTTTEIVGRLLCLHACAASAYGFPKAQAIDWADRENLVESFEPPERDFLYAHGDNIRFQYQIEAMFALNWALGQEQSPNWFEYVDDEFVLRLPDLKSGESAGRFRSMAQLKPISELMQSADLAYCMHWIAREDALSPKSQKLPFASYVAEERRRALDWIIGTESWYDVPLDT